MVGIISNDGLGLFDSSMDRLGTTHGQPTSLGQAKGSANVNIATGNLSIQFLDETLSGKGADLLALRTYNSRGGLTDGDGEGWRWLGEKRVDLTGTLNNISSTVTLTLGDGGTSTFTWLSANTYRSTDGSGGHDILEWKSATSEWVLTEDGGPIQHYFKGSDGWISKTRDTTGTGVGFDYAFTGNKLVSVTDIATGQYLKFLYGTDGRLETLQTFSKANSTDAGILLSQVSYVYYKASDSAELGYALGLLKTVSTSLFDEANSTYTTTYRYTSDKKIESLIQSDGSSASFEYYTVADGVALQDKIKKVTDQNGETTFTYGTNSTAVKNALNETWTYTYDATSKQLRTVVSSFGTHNTYNYDTDGNVTSVTNGTSNTITYEYDNNETDPLKRKGNRTKEVDTLGNTITRTFGTKNEVLTETRYSVASPTAPGGAETTRYVYDTSTRLKFVVTQEGRVTENFYNAFGLLTSTRQYAAKSFDLTTTPAPTLANLSSWTTAFTADEKKLQQLTKYEYDYRGNLEKKTSYAKLTSTGESDPSSADDVIQYSYDEYGRLLHTITSRTTSDKFTAYTYDGMGRQINVINGAGTTTTVYSGVNITVTNEASGLKTVSTTDNRGRITSLTQSLIDNSKSRTTKYYYNKAGQLRMTEDPTGARNYVFYDAAGRVSARVDATGAATAYTYNRNNQIVTEIRHTNTVSTSTWFDNTKPDGEKIVKTSLVINVAGTAGLDIATDTTNDRKTTNTYFESGLLKTTTVDGTSAIVNTYDGASRLIKTVQSGRITKYYYDKDGRQRGVLNAERNFTEMVYDSVGRLIQTTRYDGQVSTTNQALEVAQDPETFNKVKADVATNVTLSSYFFYDGEGRQVGVVNEQGFLTETVYDAVNNLRKTIQYKTPVTVLSDSTLSSLRTSAGASNTTTTKFDKFGRVETVTTQDATVNRNVYDAAGRLSLSIQAEGTSDHRASAIRYNAFGETVNVVSGTGLTAASTQTDINTAISTNGTTYEIDGAGRKVAVLGPVEAGKPQAKTFLFYNAAGQLTYTVNALGEVSKTTYNSFGQVSEVRVYTERLSSANLATITTGGLDSNISGKVVTGADTIVSTTYNKLGLVYTQTDAQGFVTTNTYNNYGLLYDSTRTIVSGSSAVTTRGLFGYDLLGRLRDSYADYDGLRARTTVNYDGLGRVSQTIDANRKTTTTAYDINDNGRTITVTDPLSRTSKIKVDFAGRTVESHDGFGKITYYTHDDTARKTTVTTPENITITTWKTRTGETLQVQDGKGQNTTYTYTTDGQLKTVKNHSSVTLTENFYDNSGRLYESKDANGTITRYTYDAANRVIEKAIDPTGLNLRTSYEFDGQGRQIKVTEGLGTTEATKTEYKYDRKGQISQIIIDPDNLKLSTKFTYDGLGQTTKVEKGTVASPSQQVTEYTFDKLGRKIKEVVDPGSGKLNITTHYKYDANGNLTRVIDANDNSTWYVYDNAGQKTLSINALGNVTQFTYDKNGRLQQTRQFANSISANTLASLGDIVTSNVVPTISSQDRRSINIYDKDGRTRYSVNLLSDTLSTYKWTVTESIYDNNNLLVEQRAYDKTLTDSQINGMWLLTSAGGTDLLATEMGTLVNGFGYSPSTPGTTRVTRWEYDVLGRKTAEILDATTTGLNITTQFRYDTAGNLTRVISPNDASTWYVYNKAGQKTLDINALGEVTAYEYDGLGKVHHTRRYKNTVATTGFGNIVTTVTLPSATTDDRRNYVVNDAAGRLKYTLNALSATEWIVTENTYDAMGNVKSIIAYDNTISESQITSITPAGSGKQITAAELASLTATFYSTSVGEGTRVTRYDYDAAGRQIKTTLPGWYDQSNGRVYAYQEGYSYRFERTIEVKYDAMGNAISNTIRVGMGNTIDDYVFQYKTYDSLGRLVFDIDALGAVTQNQYDNLGNLSSVSRYASSIGLRDSTNTPWTTVEVAATNQIQLGSKRTIQYQYNTLGQQVKVIQPTTSNNWLVGADLLSGTEYSGAATIEFVYSNFGQLMLQRQLIDNTLTAQGKPNTADTYYFYDNIGRQTWVVDPLKYGTKTEYNSMGKAIRITEYSNAGNAIETIPGTITSPWTQSYNRDLNFVFTENGQQDRITEYDYDLLGRVEITRRRLEGFGLTRTNTTDYNSFGDIITSVDALDNITSMTHNRLGMMKSIVEPKRFVAGTTSVDVFKGQVDVAPTTTFNYNVFGDRTSESRNAVGGLGGAITIQHILDLAGNEIQTIDGLGNSSYTEYNVAGKVIRQWQQVSVTGATSDMNYAHTIDRHFEYDKVGRQRAVYDVYLNNLAGQSYTYNSFGEVTEEHKLWGPRTKPVTNELFTLSERLANPGFNAVVASYDYDNMGRMSSKTAADGITLYSYNFLGNITRVKQQEANNVSNQRISESTYDKRGYTILQRSPESAVTELFGTLNTVNRASTILQTVDRWGNVISRTDATNKTTHFTYNQDNQLLSQRGPSTSRIGYNRQLDETLLEYRNIYDKLGRVVQEKQIVLNAPSSGAPNGSYVDSRTTTNIYNSAGQLTGTVDASGVSQNYVYDIHNNRVGTQNSIGHVTVDAYDANSKVTERFLLRNGLVGEYKGETNISPTAISLGKYFYDQAGRMYAEANAETLHSNGTTRIAGNKHYYRYDERNNLIRERNRINNVKHYYYDELNHKVRETIDELKIGYHPPASQYGQSIPYEYTVNHELNEWTYSIPGSYGSSVDFKDYAVDQLQSRQVLDKTNLTYDYAYNGFGQLKLETQRGTNNTVAYSYYNNGMQKSIVETATTGYTTTSSTSTYYYDIKGNRTAEFNHVDVDVSAHEEMMYIGSSGGGGFGGSYYIPVMVPGYSYSSGDLKSFYQYDSLNRLIKVQSPPTSFLVNTNNVSTSNLNYLTYDYDGFGNRRRITASYVLPDNTAGAKEEWYSYDAAGRVEIEAGGSNGTNATILGTKGVLYRYDNAGRRVTDESWKYTTNYNPNGPYGSGVLMEVYHENTYTYNDLGLTQSITLKSRMRQQGIDYSGTAYNEWTYLPHETNTYDNRGFRITAANQNQVTTNQYRNDGSLIGSTTNSDARLSKLHNYVYDYMGNLLSYRYSAYKNHDPNNEDFYYDYSYQYADTLNGRQQARIEVKTGQGGTGVGTTTNNYDTRGRLISSNINERHPSENSTGTSYRQFAYNTAGQIIVRAELKYGVGGGYKVQNYYYSTTGGELANVGAKGVDISPLSAIYQGGAVPGSYTVNEGDTLMGIAQALFGDAKLWYVIADANGLNMGPTESFGADYIGRNLRVPNSDKTVANTSVNWKPYNPSEVIGDLTPSVHIIPPKKLGCQTFAKVIGVIVQIIVTVVVTIATYGNVAAGAAAGAAAGNYATQYSSLMLNGQFDWEAWAEYTFSTENLTNQSLLAMSDPATLLTIASVNSDARDSLLRKTDPLAGGVPEGSIDYESIAISGAAGYVGGAVAGGVAGAATAAGASAGTAGFIGGFAGGAAGYAANYGLNRLAGNDPSFSLRGMATAAVASGIIKSLGASDTSSPNPNPTGVTWGDFNWEQMADEALKSIVSAGVNYGVGKVFDPQNTHWDGKMVLADAFGNGLGTGIARLNYAKAEVKSKQLDPEKPGANQVKNIARNRNDVTQEQQAQFDRESREELTRATGKDSGDVAINARNTTESRTVYDRRGRIISTDQYDSQGNRVDYTRVYDKDGNDTYVLTSHLRKQTAIAKAQWNGLISSQRAQNIAQQEAVVLMPPSSMEIASLMTSRNPSITAGEVKQVGAHMSGAFAGFVIEMGGDILKLASMSRGAPYLSGMPYSMTSMASDPNGAFTMIDGVKDDIYASLGNNDFATGARDPSARLGVEVATLLTPFGIARKTVTKTVTEGATNSLDNVISSTHPLQGLTPTEVIAQTEQLGLTASKDAMVLWSGLGKNGAATAAKWARANGGVTLEMTPGGKWLNDMKLYGESSPFTSEQADLIWSTVSSKFVSSANGQVRAVLGNVRPTSIYKTVELPSVLNNTSVSGLDTLQLRAMSPLDFVNY